MPLLDLRAIGKSFPGVDALRNVDLVADRGEVHALVGANGAGKSTLIGLLSGLFPPSTGSIAIAGREVTFRSPREAREAGISTVYQELTVLPNLSVAENVFLGREPRSRFGLVDFARLHADARELFNRFGLHLDSAAIVGRLSLAHRQIVELARALSTASQILILDELTAGLSTAEQALLFRIVERLRDAGLLILYVSHRLEEVFALADRVTVLRDGERVTTRDVSGLSVRELVRFMVGHDLSDRFDLPAVGTNAPRLEAKVVSAAGSSQFALRYGEILGLAGILGSGRTRLAKSLTGLASGAQAEIRIGGKRTVVTSPKEAISHGIFYITEDRKAEGLFANLSVLANTTAGALVRFARFGIVRTRPERTAAADVLDRMRLVARSLDAPIRQLSGGNQQKTLLARALLCGPGVLICDEPTRGVDVGAKDQIYEILLGLAARGIGVIFISSEPKELLAICHRLLIVRDGRVCGETSPTISEHELIMMVSNLATEDTWTRPTTL
jgi:ABC-type sugar transport system ATPase subunit